MADFINYTGDLLRYVLDHRPATYGPRPVTSFCPARRAIWVKLKYTKLVKQIYPSTIINAVVH